MPVRSVLCKAISKLLCGRLKKVLPSIVDIAKAAFIMGRNILHNVLPYDDIVKRYGIKSSKPKLLMKFTL